ncbi:hypothetical protein FR943_12275 [Mycobacterium sp. TNTM28]|uniref:Uncharacterized protein n=1 Tax=[Mycobacterium] fortunisiensis TaxID=2600579 RepID=A0ABS6KM18_9MYCO|nr:UPF0158 family protein [[Mycobacterium] fortunisiensis]MBU9764621.1 hypothetical protein [[Mycobacterium] fortunisiensis]
MAGNGLLDAVTAGVPRATDLAAECAAALRIRDWDGDIELADHLDAVCGSGATPMLRPLPIDLDDLSTALHGNEVVTGARIHPETGEVRYFDRDYEEFGGEDEDGEDEGDEDDSRWLYVDSTGSREGYHDMEVFISTVADPDIVDRLEIAITGSGAFRRFKDVLSRWPDELTRYFAIRDDRELGRARAWLAEQGYRPASARRINP